MWLMKTPSFIVILGARPERRFMNDILRKDME
jgi:hypothetical protein